MKSDPTDVGYFVFDIEAIADGHLVSSLKYPGQGLMPQDAVKRFRAELLETTGKDVFPPTYVLPISIAVAKVSREHRLLDVCVLDDPAYRPHVMTRLFWQGWRHYGRPVLVTFNGRGYDLPVLEYAAYRYGMSLPDWFNVNAPTYEQSRNRYNTRSHLDLVDLFSNFGATRVNGGLNLMARLIGKPGKTGVDGSQVQDMYDAGQTAEINDYCRCDVLDTYFVFLRTRVLLGRLTLEQEQELVEEAKRWIAERAGEVRAFSHYLENWGDWSPPED
ncbi:MAG: 3'-5' exonuclease [Planctomyces sp.]|nr:3'-5' exonuclease [Planctomyces sp.]